MALFFAIAILGDMGDGDSLAIPDDLSACQALIRQQAHTIESHALTIEQLNQQKLELEREKQELKLAFTELLQRAFRRRSERYLEDPSQLRIDFGNTADAADAAQGLAAAIDESQAETVVTQTVAEHTRTRRVKPRNERLYEVFQEAVKQGRPSVTAHMWAYRSVTVPLNVFDFTVSWHRDGPDAFLEGFAGALLADCYSGYQGIALRSEGAVRGAACCAHARRKVFDARDAYPKEASSGRTDVNRICLKHLMDYAGEGAGINKLDGVLLSDYHQKLAGMVKRKEIESSTAKDRFDTVKQFIRWLWGRDQIDLPKNIETLGIKQTTKVIETITDDQVASILNAASERTRLYVLLALNCGFTQVDISGLRQDQVDWKTGRIIYKRSKTRLHADVPTVDYRLWPETTKLLKQHRSEGSDLALLNEDGQPLLQEGERDGKHFKIDNIRSAIERVLKVVKDKYPFKIFRKTAASKLAETAEHARFVQHFLGHSPRTVADKYYVKPSQPQFDAAVKWLGEQFGY